MGQTKLFIAISLFFILFFTTTILHSSTASKSQVEKVATHFLSWKEATSPALLKKRSPITIKSIHTRKDSQTSENLFHVVSLEPKGFVVISADTDLEPVIAYSVRHDWQTEIDSTDILSTLLQSDMKLRKKYLPHMPLDRIERNNEKWLNFTSYSFQQWPEPASTTTSGWLETTWHQKSPFNDFCPLDPDSNEKSVVGCVATALAQIIHYHEYIGDVSFLPTDSYKTLTKKIKIDADSLRLNFLSFKSINSRLDSIRYKYETHIPLDDTDIAALNFACGILVEMDYSSIRSGAYASMTLKSLTERLGYNNAATVEESEKLYPVVKKDIMSGLPVQLFIDRNNEKVGHSIVADGYNTDGFYHLNFGWTNDKPDPITDAWYLLPEHMGAGYNIISLAIVDIQPSHLAQTNLVAKDSTIHFSPCPIGEPSAMHSCTLLNAGESAVEIDYIITSDFFFLSETTSSFVDSIGSFIVQPGENFNFYVQCQPDSFGSFSGDIIVSYAQGKKYLTIDVNGYGMPETATVVNSGDISGSWNKQGSPYLICGDIAIESGQTLTIDARTEILFLGPYRMDIPADAQLIAKGTAIDSIRFSSGYHGAWLGCNFLKSGEDDTLSFCVFSDGKEFKPPCGCNQKEIIGGAMMLENSSPTISHSRFTRNRDGAIYCDTSHPKIAYCKFDFNSGSALVCAFSNPDIRYCFIEHNTAATGGALRLSASSPHISHTTITGNNAVKGGALYLSGSSPTITFSHINSNSADQGGAFYCKNASPIIKNTLFYDNAADDGGVLYSQDGAPVFSNVTICYNQAENIGGIACLEQKNHVLFKNSILWANQAQSGAVLAFTDNLTESNTVTFSYSNIDTSASDWYHQDSRQIIWDYGTMSKDPLFKDVNSNDFSLLPESPCIDSGDPNDEVGEESFPHGYRVNMGRYGGTLEATQTTALSLAVTPYPINFGNVPPAVVKTSPLFIKNGCAEAIHIISIICSDPEHFSISASGSQIDTLDEIITLEPGSIHSFQVTFYSEQQVDFIFQANISIKTTEGGDITLPVQAHTFLGTRIDAGSVAGVWEKQNSPYNIHGDITIASDQSLLIEPGVTIRFMGHYGIKINENAQLKAIGTESDSIRFCAMDTTPGWAGLYFEKSLDDTLAYCVLSNSHAPENGGAIFLEKSSITILHSSLIKNQSSYTGGAIFSIYSSLTLSHCTINQNNARAAGGLCIFESTATIQNTLICSNQAGGCGGVQVFKSPVSFLNVTISHNKAVKASGGLSIDYTRYASFRNSIIWANEAPWAKTLSMDNTTLVEFNYCDMDTTGERSVSRNSAPDDPQPCTLRWGEGNIIEDPLFTNAAQNDFTLQPESPCIDAGDPDSSYFDLVNPGNPEIALWPSSGGRRNDMGSYGGNLQKCKKLDVKLSHSPEHIDFGDMGSETTKEMTLYLTNNTTGTIHLKSISISDPLHFGVSYFPHGQTPTGIRMVLESGATDSVRITFTPDLVQDPYFCAFFTLRTIECEDYIVKTTGGTITGTMVQAGDVSGLWEKEKSPYNIFGEISIPSYESLVIEPGTTIRFMGAYGLTVGENARLHAAGTESDSIRFHTLDTVTGWRGITIRQSQDDDTLSYCIITNAKDGGTEQEPENRNALRIENSSPTISHSRFMNSHANWGGAIFCLNSSFTLTHCSFRKNGARWGGAIYCYSSTLKIVECKFEENSAPCCGAILLNRSQSSIILNSLFYKNIGGAISAVNWSSLTIINTIIAKNNSTVFGGGIDASFDTNIVVKNSIIWDNQAPYGATFSMSNGPNIKLEYSNVDTLNPDWLHRYDEKKDLILWGEGTICQDPLFTNSVDGDFTLKKNSPCIDSGDPDSLFYDFEDPNKPGYALWPALGTIRNDMGLYGGHILDDSCSFDDNENDNDIELPESFALMQNYPNPFHQETIIKYNIRQESSVIITIHNLLGQRIKKLVHDIKDVGIYQTCWDGKDEFGNNLCSGLYFCKMKAHNFECIKKIMLVR